MTALPAYRLVAFDLDGTLLNFQKEIRPDARAELLRLHALGVSIVLASGRHPHGVARVARDLGVDGVVTHLLCFNGGRILDCATGESLVNHTMSAAVARRAAAAARAAGLAVISYTDDAVVAEQPDNEYVCLEAAVNGLPLRGVQRLDPLFDGSTNKLLAVGPAKTVDAAEQQLPVQLADICTVSRSSSVFLEIMPRGIDKALSLSLLLDRLGLSPAQMVAFGDGMNDKSMIEFAGVGVAMGNASEEVRRAADLITHDCNSNGISSALRALWPRALYAGKN